MGLGGVGGLRDDLLACSIVYSLAQLSFEVWHSLPTGLWKVVAWLIFFVKEKLEVYPLLPQEAPWQWLC